MSYRLHLDAPAGDAVRAVTLERLDRASRRLREDHGRDPAAAVHGARKDLKKARAVLRLARPCLPKKVRRRENAELAEIGRGLSAGRDADVMVETVDALAGRFAGRLPKRQFTALKRRLSARAEQARDETSVDDAVVRLQEARTRIEQWALDGCGPQALVAGATRAYGSGREAFAAARQDPSSDRLHDWRKRVKDLWYHHRLLVDAWPGPVEAFADECDRLGELLGDDHDLATLAALLGDGDAEAAPPSVEVDRIIELIAERRDELRHEAFALGRNIYAEKPKAFACRLDVYLTAARGREHEPQIA